MVIDTSALFAILLGEPEQRRFNQLIEEDRRRFISAATLLETSIVVECRHGESAGRELDLFVHRARFNVLSVDVEQAEIARRAYRKYGKGRHKAGLNFGDCFAYAAVKITGEPLLFKGRDFDKTDVLAVDRRRRE